MATAKKVWGGVSNALAFRTAVSSTTIHSSVIDLETNGYEGCLVTVEYDANGTTDNLNAYIYPSLSATTSGSSVPDENAIISASFGNNKGVTQYSTIVVSDLSYFWVGLKSDGGTDTFASGVTVNPWRWDVT
ncbi:MAG: hypothetical protein FVQ80_07035 [Planctomycetes bacterium]|nr:hypothetical protein [Planctomycetota bacterium]